MIEQIIIEFSFSIQYITFSMLAGLHVCSERRFLLSHLLLPTLFSQNNAVFVHVILNLLPVLILLSEPQ